MADDKLNWHTEQRKINDLLPMEHNPRQMTKDQVAALKASIEKFNFVEIPAVDIDNTILAGHQRLGVMKLLGRGDELIDVRVPNRLLTADERNEYNIRSNANTGGWDWDLLANFDKDWLKQIGFNEKELLKGLDIERTTTEDEAPPAPTNPISQRGDLFILGNHRLLCGDSGKKEDVDRLLDGKEPDMVYTDPPYGNLIITNKKGEVGRSNVAKVQKYHRYANDGDFDFTPCWEIIKDWDCKKVIWGGNYFANILPITTSWIVWDKRAGEHSWFSDCELAWSNLGKPARVYSIVWQGMIRQGESDGRVHPTQKPIALAAKIMSGDNILDLFGGSGSTLIACE
jgi:16S rRNA G966 N2-methylase RsmD